MMKRNSQFWFIVGAQHLYGSETIDQVYEHATTMMKFLNESSLLESEVVCKPVVKSSSEIEKVISEANNDERCAGIITWMHTFSPAKMWIAGLIRLQKPLLHFATQYNRDIPWGSIDMDFMNLNQSAHGDREYGYMQTRLRQARKIVVGHWQDEEVIAQIGGWMRTAIAAMEARSLKVARFGDNMREVAVTDGDKIEAQIKLGWTVNGYGIGELVTRMNQVSEAEVTELMKQYEQQYDIPNKSDPAVYAAIAYQAKIEIALKAFLDEGGYSAFTTTFEDLFGMDQLPGLAAQRLMEQGYGFAGEGDWKTAALVRMLKIMSNNIGTSFMEDYTYHLEQGNELVLGSHMLEVCPTIAVDKPTIEVHPLGIGGKNAPARIVFNGKAGKALNASIVDMGNRFRLVINEVEAVAIKSEQAMPKLPVARVLWQVKPDLKRGVECWIRAGGAHHTAFSYTVTTEQLLDLAEILDIEAVVIDEATDVLQFRQQLKYAEAAWLNRV
ncbi:L-arabinose isomerase [Paenibacillus yanchengensis]|uniref:L-arabinose isomerase n=1 Tax=Paenibacillus yanchengensis TaxID=2035833 RepID=A0ABW4YQB2_9BACL